MPRAAGEEMRGVAPQPGDHPSQLPLSFTSSFIYSLFLGFLLSSEGKGNKYSEIQEQIIRRREWRGKGSHVDWEPAGCPALSEDSARASSLVPQQHLSHRGHPPSGALVSWLPGALFLGLFLILCPLPHLFCWPLLLPGF